MLHKLDYTINGRKNGPLLLKKIIMLTYIDTRATTAHIRNSLINMMTQFKTLDGDVTKFNAWVNGQVSQLRARGVDAPDLTSFLWNTYQGAPDSYFVSYVNRLWDSDIDGRNDYTPEQLMSLADNKYKERIQSGNWKKPSSHEEEIVALTTRINELTKDKPNKPKGKDSKTNRKRKDDKQGRDWLSKRPTGDETKERGIPIQILNKKKYHWCPHHHDGQGLWVIHHPSECRNIPKADDEKNANVAAFDTEGDDDDNADE
jgi:hypothetical protein